MDWHFARLAGLGFEARARHKVQPISVEVNVFNAQVRDFATSRTRKGKVASTGLRTAGVAFKIALICFKLGPSRGSALGGRSRARVRQMLRNQIALAANIRDGLHDRPTHILLVISDFAVRQKAPSLAFDGTLISEISLGTHHPEDASQGAFTAARAGKPTISATSPRRVEYQQSRSVDVEARACQRDAGDCD
jgi:hypothetical protein